MRALIILLGLFLLLAPPARADDLSAAREAIAAQADAFGRDDAQAAYGFAAPGVQALFPEADAFMAMVKRSYGPVYRHKSFEFGKSGVKDGKIAWEVSIVDADDVAWTALYTLEPQEDGGVKITGCMLIKAGQAV